MSSLLLTLQVLFSVFNSQLNVGTWTTLSAVLPEDVTFQISGYNSKNNSCSLIGGFSVLKRFDWEFLVNSRELSIYL